MRRATTRGARRERCGCGIPSHGPCYEGLYTESFQGEYSNTQMTSVEGYGQYAQAMKVFISWSGNKSQSVASALGTSIRNVIQDADCFFSPEIEAGTQWLKKINSELSAHCMGVICVTADNQYAPSSRAASSRCVSPLTRRPCCSIRPRPSGPFTSPRAVITFSSRRA